MKHFGRDVDIHSILNYEEEEHFRCYQYEINPSIGVNVHVLKALQDAEYPQSDETVKKILQFLRGTRQEASYWFDKWHVSPYYITSHIIISCLDYDPDLCSDSVQWILNTQKADGSWGFYGKSTAEETSYCIQALKIWENSGHKLPAGRIQSSRLWLEKNAEKQHPWLWIGKTLYYPEHLVKSTILTALGMVKE